MEVNQTRIEEEMVISLRDKELNVLVVDHQTAPGEAIPALLRGQGCRVYAAHTDTEAVVILQSREIHIVVADILLSRMSGLTLIKNIREELCMDVPIIALTHTGSEEIRDLAMKLGADTFITKPVDAAMFLHQVETLASTGLNKQSDSSTGA